MAQADFKRAQELGMHIPNLQEISGKAQRRIWLEKTGEHYLNAVLAGMDGRQVLLKDGDKDYSVPIDRLSQNDQHYLTVVINGGEVKVERNNKIQHVSFN